MSVPPITRLQTNFLASRYDTGTPQETPIPDVTYAGESFRKTYFDLQPGSVAVAANQPMTKVPSILSSEMRKAGREDANRQLQLGLGASTMYHRLGLPGSM